MCRILLLLVISFLLSCQSDSKVQRDNPEMGKFTEILYTETDAIKYFSVYVELTDQQKNNIQSIASQYGNQLKALDKTNRTKNTGRFIIKFISQVIREVLTMEQAEKFIAEDPWANELFAE